MEISLTLNNELVFDKDFSKKDRIAINQFTGEIFKNNRLTKCAIFVIAGLQLTNNVLADVSETMSKVDSAGYQFLGLIQRLGFWICLIGCLLEILMAVFRQGRGKEAILPIFMKWFGIFAGLYLIPEAFKLFRDLF